MKVKDVMRMATVSLPQNATLQTVIQTFTLHHVDAMPIVDAAQRVVGLIGVNDLTTIFLPRYYEFLRDFSVLEDKGQIASVFELTFAGLGSHDERLVLAADVMHPDLQWINQEESLLFAAARLRAQAQQKLPVVDRDQKLVGMIYDHDIILSLLQGSAVPAPAAKTRR